MNKLLIVLLAVCLVSVHAFVKRDAPEAATSMDDIANNFKKGAEDWIKQLGEKVNPENIKKELNDLVDKVSKAAESIKIPGSEAPKS